jgi:AcrR family transcriptional regulator
MARPTKHDERTSEALLDAAETLLATGGIQAVSVRSVADAVGVSTRAVYSVFGSMPALINALAARGFGMLADLVEAAPTTDDPLDDLVGVSIAGFRAFALQRPHLFRVTFEEMTSQVITDPVAGAELHRAFDALAARIERAMDAGLLQRRPVVEVGFGFHSLCHGLAVNELSRREPPDGPALWQRARGVDGESLWRLAVGAFVAGLTTER